MYSSAPGSWNPHYYTCYLRNITLYSQVEVNSWLCLSVLSPPEQEKTTSIWAGSGQIGVAQQPTRAGPAHYLFLTISRIKTLSSGFPPWNWQFPCSLRHEKASHVLLNRMSSDFSALVENVHHGKAGCLKRQVCLLKESVSVLGIVASFGPSSATNWH